MLHISFAEDDPAMALQLRQYLDRYGAEHGLELEVRSFASGDELLRQYDTSCDILLLDVEMPGIDGMETARALRQRDRDVVIVFITNIARYAVDGYEVEALDFILKPVNYFTFSVKLDRAVRRARQQARHTVCLQLADGMQMLDTQEIYYLETRDRMLYYHTDKGVFRLRGIPWRSAAGARPLFWRRWPPMWEAVRDGRTDRRRSAGRPFLLAGGHVLY